MIANRSVHASRPARRIARCVAVALAMALALGAAAALAAVRSGHYSGTTSEGGAVTLTVAGGRITHFHALLGYNGKCGQGGGPGLTAAPVRIAIPASGRFSANVTLSLTGIATPIHDPGRVFGRASGSQVTGTIEQFLKGNVNRCYVETFSARRH